MVYQFVHNLTWNVGIYICRRPANVASLQYTVQKVIWNFIKKYPRFQLLIVIKNITVNFESSKLDKFVASNVVDNLDSQ